jgi:hypothetical protein
VARVEEFVAIESENTGKPFGLTLSLYGFEDYTRIEHVMSSLGQPSSVRDAPDLSGVGMYHTSRVGSVINVRLTPIRTPVNVRSNFRIIEKLSYHQVTAQGSRSITH